MPTGRESILAAFRREEPGVVPFDFHRFTPAAVETFRRNAGADDPLGYFIEPEVPWENIVAYVAAVYEFGGYT